MLQKDYEHFIALEVADDIAEQKHHVVRCFLDATIGAAKLGISLNELMSYAKEQRDIDVAPF